MILFASISVFSELLQVVSPGTSKDIFLMNVLQINSAKGFVAITVRYTKVTKLNSDGIQPILNIFKHIKLLFVVYTAIRNYRSKVSKL